MTVTTATAAPTEARRSPRSMLARAFGVTALFSAGGSLLGLFRDLLLARYFGAGPSTDAFLVSWTVPETAAPLLIEDAMAFLMVPAFSAAIATEQRQPAGPATVPVPAAAPGPPAPRAAGSSALTTGRHRAPAPRSAEPTDAAPDRVNDPAPAVAELLAATLPPLAGFLALISAAALLGAPLLVHLLAPGLADPGLAVVCTRLTALTVLPFGLTGYFSAGLRAHQRFTAPGAVYVAYNTGILAVMLLLHGSLGVRAAAGGVALGSVLMTAVLLPPFSRHCVGLRRLGGRAGRSARSRSGPVLTLSPLALLPIALFTFSRQAQVFVERYLASSLAPGTISHLNYAEKVAQMAMTLGILVCTVTFPVVARALAEGDLETARRRVESDLGLVGAVVLAGTAVLMACAPQIVDLLFQRGAFTVADTSATAAVIRVYSLGLLGQALVGTLVRPFFSTRPAVAFGRGPSRTRDRSDWYPLASMLLGLLVTVVLGVLGAPRYGALGLAAANAAGISLTAVLLLFGLRSRGVALRLRPVLLVQARLLVSAALATVAGYAAAATAAPDPLPAVLLGGAAAAVAFVLAAAALGVPTVAGPLSAIVARSRNRGRTNQGEGRRGR